MAVYEHSYKPYTGVMSPEWSRFLIIPRHALKDVFQSKLFVAFFGLCFIGPLVMAILIYLHYNSNALLIMELRISDLVRIDEGFFQLFVEIQSSLAFLMALLIGPPLVSRDMANNALPLYLCRPFSRAEYVVGKMSVLVILLSSITWIPGLILFILQAALGGASWFGPNLWIGGAILIGSWAWIVLLALLSITISSWVKWRIAASAGLFAVFAIPSVVGVMISQLFNTRWGNIVSLGRVMEAIIDGLFATGAEDAGSLFHIPAGAAWVAFAVYCAICLLLLSRRVRAYEVVR
jgi:ABC-2 type transport system permease protein